MKKRNEHLRALMKKRMKERRNKLKVERKKSEDQLVLKQPIPESVTNTITLTYDKVIKPPSPVRKVKKSSSTVEKPLPMSKWINPGPGYYNTTNEYIPEIIKKSHKAVCFNYHGVIRKHEVELKSILGPGSHTLPTKSCAPMITFNGKVNDSLLEKVIKKRRKLVENNSAQADYIDPVSSFGKSPVTKFDSLPKLIIKESRIGPGSYNPILPDYSNKFTMTERRSKSVVRMVPGPAKYKLDNPYKYLHSSPESSFGMLTTLKNINTTPGPGAYNPIITDPVISCKYYLYLIDRIVKHTKTRRKVAAIVTQIRERTSREEKKKNINTTFPKAPRMESSPLFSTPAPNAYQRIIQSKRGNRGAMLKKGTIEICTFGSKPKKYVDADPTPGPSTYPTDYLTRSTHGVVIGKTGHIGLQEKFYTDKFYDIVDLYKGPKIKFGSEEKSTTIKKTDLPGPGSYKTISYIGNLPKYALRTINN